jgi:DNA end-binding protein Ku
MAARAIWKARIVFGTVDVPVRLYSAVEDRTVHFRLLDEKRLEPVKQRMVEPTSGEVVPPEEIRRAYQTEGGELVVLDEDELAGLEPEASREIEIARFVPTEAITHQWYDRPYYLGPDGSEGDYFALQVALRRQAKEGVARWVMRKKEYVGALRAEGDYLMLITLRHAGEVIPVSALEPPGGRDLAEREVRMAKQLIAAMEDELDIAAYRDEYRERVLELVHAKAAGKVVKFPKPPRRQKEKSLADVLERSLAQAGKERASA